MGNIQGFSDAEAETSRFPLVFWNWRTFNDYEKTCLHWQDTFVCLSNVSTLRAQLAGHYKWLSLSSYVFTRLINFMTPTCTSVQETHISPGWVLKGRWRLLSEAGWASPISQDAPGGTRKVMSPPLSTNRWPLEGVGSGFPSCSDLAVQIDADGLLIHLINIYGEPTMWQ